MTGTVQMQTPLSGSPVLHGGTCWRDGGTLEVVRGTMCGAARCGACLPLTLPEAPGTGCCSCASACPDTLSLRDSGVVASDKTPRVWLEPAACAPL